MRCAEWEYSMGQSRHGYKRGGVNGRELSFIQNGFLWRCGWWAVGSVVYLNESFRTLKPWVGTAREHPEACSFCRRTDPHSPLSRTPRPIVFLSKCTPGFQGNV